MKTAKVKNQFVGYIDPEMGDISLLPDSVEIGDYETTVNKNGETVLTSDYSSLRKTEYPEIGDQLDALYRAGVFPEEMANQISAVKARFPKTINNGVS